MYDIGTKFEYELEDSYGWCYKTLTIGGYTYYQGDLFYVCYGEDGKQLDVYEDNVKEAIEGVEDED
jgi:hypothetical protein